MKTEDKYKDYQPVIIEYDEKREYGDYVNRNKQLNNKDFLLSKFKKKSSIKKPTRD